MVGFSWRGQRALGGGEQGGKFEQVCKGRSEVVVWRLLWLIGALMGLVCWWMGRRVAG